ncbi:ABC transporter permease [Phytoactinopolyspora mesophila]|uniref:ABC transporter permease n=1 Tax=Phytoactinopolyspora mesophila TaxID=2650750 RepID=A0A7K3MAZ4_9ACTN|nr:ABC transporter permease [Phytoactinopolyspora mesophila]NDL60426.1 ABC transporter permease [Phytoactinopolyspora mesophila]
MATAITAPPARHRTEPGRQNTLAGTGTLVRFGLRRDRVRLSLWAGGIVLMTLLINATWEENYGDREELLEIAQTLDSPAMIAMVGVNHAGVEGTSYGSMMGQQMFWFTLIAVAIMSILTMVRHTRAEEEANRAELVRASVVGRHAYLTSALIIVGFANVAVGLLMAVGLGAMDVPTVDWAGSWLYGTGHIVVGLAFAGIAAIAIQITGYSRGAAGWGFSALGVAYVLRAMGDAGENALNWLSPIGWAQETRVYVDNRWWPLLIAVVAAVAFAAIGYYLSIKRDVGAGLRAARLGKPTASDSLTTPLGFAVRLHRGLLIGFGIGVMLLGASYGSILGDVESLLEDVTAFAELTEGLGGTALEAFSAQVLAIMAIISSIYVVLAMQRPRSEETSGRAEPLLSTAVSRSKWLSSHLAIASIGGLAMLLLVGIGFAGAGVAAAGENAVFGDLLAGSLVYVPALWVTAGVAVALMAWVPRATMLTWLIVVYSFVVVYLGNILQVPEWTRNLTPFGHVPQVPSADFDIVPLLILTAVAAGLYAFGLYGFRRRDLETK